MPNSTPYSRFSVELHLDGAAVAATQLVAVKSAKHKIYVTKVIEHVITHVDGKAFTLQSSNGTPVKLFERIDDAEGAGEFDTTEADFGDIGTSVATGEDLNYVANAAGSGSVARITVQGYQKLVGPVTIAQAASGG